MKINLLFHLIASLIFLNFPFAYAVSLDFSSFGGGQIDNRGQGYTFFGIDISNKINEGYYVKVRIVPNYLTYKYKSNNRTIRAYSPGINILGGLKIDENKISISILGGLEYRNTNLNPDLKDAKVRGDTFAPSLQGELNYRFSKYISMDFYGSYSGTDNFFYEKFMIKSQISNFDFKKPDIFHLGCEQFYGKNPDFRMLGLGPFFEIYNIQNKISLSFRSGYTHDKNFRGGIYGGIQFFKAF